MLLAGHNECPFCHYVYRQISTKRGIPCPSCKVPIDCQQGYFRLSVDVLIDLMQEYYHLESIFENKKPDKDWMSGNHKLAVIIFFCSLGEVLLHHFLEALMIAQDIPFAIQDRLFNDNRFLRGRVGKLFPSLTGDKWKTAIGKINNGKEIDYNKTLSLFLKVYNVRNKFLHRGNAFAVPRVMPEECIRHIGPLVGFFVGLHNNYIPGIYQNKVNERKST